MNMFGLHITSTGKELLERVEEYAKSIGCFSSGIVEEKIIDVVEELNGEENIPRYKRSTTPYDLYGITRHSDEVGYVGMTCDSVAKRIRTHVKMGEIACDPFAKWLAEGLEMKDIDAGVLKSVVGFEVAKGEEDRLRHQLKPLFNKQDGEYGLIRKIGGLKPLGRLLGIDMQDQ
jgi:hypothetical protein